MVGLCGFEPQTSCVSSRRSNQTELQTPMKYATPFLETYSSFSGTRTLPARQEHLTSGRAGQTFLHLAR